MVALMAFAFAKGKTVRIRYCYLNCICGRKRHYATVGKDGKAPLEDDA